MAIVATRDVCLPLPPTTAIMTVVRFFEPRGSSP